MFLTTPIILNCNFQLYNSKIKFLSKFSQRHISQNILYENNKNTVNLCLLTKSYRPS